MSTPTSVPVRVLAGTALFLELGAGGLVGAVQDTLRGVAENAWPAAGGEEVEVGAQEAARATNAIRQRLFVQVSR